MQKLGGIATAFFVCELGGLKYLAHCSSGLIFEKVKDKTFQEWQKFLMTNSPDGLGYSLEYVKDAETARHMLYILDMQCAGLYLHGVFNNNGPGSTCLS